MRKKIAIVLLSIMTACAVMMGCEEVLSKEQAFDELDGFSAAKTATVEMGSNYTVLPVVAFGADGKEYTAAVTVTVGGQSVEVKDGTFAVTKPDDYTVTYTIEYKGYTSYVYRNGCGRHQKYGSEDYRSVEFRDNRGNCGGRRRLYTAKSGKIYV